MGIESDQLVYDYLSRVGDLAQRQQLSSGARMRLVSTLRGEIDRQRAGGGADSPAAVRRIIGRLGTPDELVARAAATPAPGGGATPAPDGGATPAADGGAVTLPSPREGAEPGADAGRGGVPGPRRGPLRKGPRGVPRKDAIRKGASEGDAGDAADMGEPPTGTEEPIAGWPSASAPHMAGLGGQTPPAGEADWWSIDPGPFGAGVDVPGFVGGLEIPELLRPPPAGPVKDTEAETEADAEAEDGAGADAAEPVRRRFRPRLRRRARTAVPPEALAPARPRFAHPFLLLAAALLVAGAVLGSWIALAGGWLLAYSSRKLSRAEAKWVAMGLPGAVVAGAFVWLWGRMDDRWGSDLQEDAMGDAMTDAWPVIVRVAAVASALYLVWRARRLSR